MELFTPVPAGYGQVTADNGGPAAGKPPEWKNPQVFFRVRMLQGGILNLWKKQFGWFRRLTAEQLLTAEKSPGRQLRE